MDIMSEHSVDIIKYGIILDQEDITTLEDTNINTEYYYAKGFKCSGFTLLHKLVLLTNKYPKLNIVIREYITSHPKEVNKVNKRGMTSLHLSSTNSNTWSSIETVKLLLLHNADVNAKCNRGHTALMRAAWHSNSMSSTETVKLLLKNSADITAKDNNGWTALTFARIYFNSMSSTETGKLLLEYDAILDKTSFEFGTFSKFVNNIKLLNALS